MHPPSGVCNFVRLYASSIGLDIRDLSRLAGLSTDDVYSLIERRRGIQALIDWERIITGCMRGYALHAATQHGDYQIALAATVPLGQLVPLPRPTWSQSYEAPSLGHLAQRVLAIQDTSVRQMSLHTGVSMRSVARLANGTGTKALDRWQMILSGLRIRMHLGAITHRLAWGSPVGPELRPEEPLGEAPPHDMDPALQGGPKQVMRLAMEDVYRRLRRGEPTGVVAALAGVSRQRIEVLAHQMGLTKANIRAAAAERSRDLLAQQGDEFASPRPLSPDGTTEVLLRRAKDTPLWAMDVIRKVLEQEQQPGQPKP